MKTLYIILFVLISLYAFKLHNKVNSYKKEIKGLKASLNNCDMAYSVNVQMLDSVVEVNRNFNNHVYRMQLIAGVKKPDSVFSYKEKIIHGKKLLKFK